VTVRIELDGWFGERVDAVEAASGRRTPKGLDGDGAEFQEGLRSRIEGVWRFAFDVKSPYNFLAGAIENGDDYFRARGTGGSQITGIGGYVSDIDRSTARDCGASEAL
jgi:hypothetical protein